MEKSLNIAFYHVYYIALSDEETCFDNFFMYCNFPFFLTVFFFGCFKTLDCLIYIYVMAII